MKYLEEKIKGARERIKELEFLITKWTKQLEAKK